MLLQSLCDGGFGSAELCSAITDPVKSVFNNESASYYLLHSFMSLHLRRPLFKAGESLTVVSGFSDQQEALFKFIQTAFERHRNQSFQLLDSRSLSCDHVSA